MSGFRDVDWKQRLRTEECLTGFDPTLLQRAGRVLSAASLAALEVTDNISPALLASPKVSGICFLGVSVANDPHGGISSVSLPQRLGPRLLVSDWGTFDQPILRWRLRIRGNMAVELGVVPLSMVVRTFPICLV